MNQQEISEFWKQVFICFPSLEEWIYSKSSDPSATIANWSKALVGITAAEALWVLEGFNTGAIKAPIGYQREAFHLHVREVVMRQRSERAGARARQEAFEKANIGAPRPEIFVSCSAVIDEIVALKNQHEAGFLSKEDFDRERELIVREAQEKIDRNARHRGVV